MATPVAVTASAAVTPPSAIAATPVVDTRAVASAAVARSSDQMSTARRSDRAVLVPGTKAAQVLPSANIKTAMLSPAIKREDLAAPPQDPMAQVLQRLRVRGDAGEIAVDRLNTLSLRAAQQGQTFSPGRSDEIPR
jgi:hypothetical protein